MTKRRFTVSGEDDLGDVHSFHTDDEERAKGMEGMMREDLENVTLETNEGAHA